MKSVSRETTSIIPVKSVLDYLSKSPLIRQFFSSIDIDKPYGLSNLSPSSLLLILGALLHQKKLPLITIVANNQVCENLYLEAFNFIENKSHYLPEMPNEERRVPGFEIEPERYLSEAILALNKRLPGIFFATPASLKQPISSPKDLKSQSFNLGVGSALKRGFFLKSLDQWNYEQADFCTTPKTFSARGGIIDIFLPYSSHPVRIELYGDTIESIRLFDPTTQRSIGSRKNIRIFPPPQSGKIENQQSIEKLLEKINKAVLYITQKAEMFCIQNNVNVDNLEYVHQEIFSLAESTLEARKEIINRAISSYNKKVRFFFDSSLSDNLFLNNRCQYVAANLPTGFHSKDFDLICLTPKEFSSARSKRRSRWSIEKGDLKHEKISSLKALNWGDYLVHQDYGIGLYRGLAKVGKKNALQETIKIEYDHGGFVYIPIDSFNKVHRYIGLGERKPKLSVLGSGKWERQKAITRKTAQETVDTLVSIYRARNQPRGFKYSNDTDFLTALTNSFPYEETQDQKKAIHTVLNDMDEPFPMDRLVYGDVGFGKTEVALRAAVKAITSGKTVFFMTPTTILADQHYITCKSRLDPLGMNVELLSRFRTKKEQAVVIRKLCSKEVDLLVGTHRLLSGDLDISNLGLLILDEEHRFGVKHKETIRQLKSKIDVLTLTATPIPRTLQQSLIGIKEISKIETAPKERLPVTTWVKYFDWAQIYRVIERELVRDGQVYFLHNDIESMPFFYEKLYHHFKNYRVATAHGKMTSKGLEKTILSFFSGAVDVLICTTIIESGLDVPNANTIIINNAHRFGLAQLYQIRGRVGRSEHQAYCYLLIPSNQNLSPEAYHRLKAIEHYSALGSGYNIALKDLEIRGAGNLFGFEQSGHISRVGFEMYSKILKEAVQSAFQQTPELEQPQVRISFAGHALIPPDFIPFVQERLSFYQQLAEAKTVDSVKIIGDELKDRYGNPPPEINNLISITWLRTLYNSLPIEEIVINPDSALVKINNCPDGITVPEFMDRLKKYLSGSNDQWTIQINKDGFIVAQVAVDGFRQAFNELFHFAGLFSKATQP